MAQWFVKCPLLIAQLLLFCPILLGFCRKTLSENVEDILVRQKRVVPRYYPDSLPSTQTLFRFRTFFHKWPWIIRLENYKQEDKLCAGSLISQNLAVTAAHCVANSAPRDLIARIVDYHVFYRDPFEQKKRVKDIIIYPFYHSAKNSTGHEHDVNDIALLVLESKIKWRAESEKGSERRNIALFPWKILSIKDIRGFTFPNPILLRKYGDCYVAGWGKTKFEGEYPDRMQEARLSLISKAECSSSKFYGEKIQTGMLCAGDIKGNWKTDSCTGDSGAPLVCRSRHKVFKKYGLRSRLDRIIVHWHLVGLVSWGYKCARHQKPGVYTDFGAYQNWIMRELKKRPQLEAEFWNSLIQCRGNQLLLEQCQNETGVKFLRKKGIFCK